MFDVEARHEYQVSWTFDFGMRVGTMRQATRGFCTSARVEGWELSTSEVLDGSLLLLGWLSEW